MPLPENFIGNAGWGQAAVEIPQRINTSNSINEILAFARSHRATDVHLSSLRQIAFRQFGQLHIVSPDSLTTERLRALMVEILPNDVMQEFDKTGDGEYVYALNGFGRFRMSMLKHHNGIDLTIRCIPQEIPSFEASGMPLACGQLTKWSQGIVLISGPAGCGKTTTLSILINMINQTRHDHIVTIEQPIEVIFQPDKCQITQREIDTHTLTQDNALRAALREDPDVLVISELRDLPTIQLAIKAAETGHLVFGSMNTVSASQTISRVIDSFASEEQSIVRNMLSESLRGVICQQLIPRADGQGMVVAYEVLVVTPSVANLIRESKYTQINNTMTTGKSFGMILMENSLHTLVLRGDITPTQAMEHSSNPNTIAQLLANK